MTPTPKAVVSQMMKDDLFSQWLGIAVIEISEGYSKIQMTIRPEMMNGLGIVHGGVAFSLADSCFAFACNNRNNLSVALDTSINFTKPVHIGMFLQTLFEGCSFTLCSIIAMNPSNSFLQV